MGVFFQDGVSRLALAVCIVAKYEFNSGNAKEKLRPFATFARELSEELFVKINLFAKETRNKIDVLSQHLRKEISV